MNTFLQQFRMFPVLDEFSGDDGGAGSADAGADIGAADFESGGEEEAEVGTEASGWLRDLSEEDGYNTLKAAQQFPDQLRALESRLFGRFGPLQENLNSVQKTLATRVNFDSSGLQKVLQEYDPTLAEKFMPALEAALNVAPLDEQTLDPFLAPVQESLQKQIGEQVVLAAYDPEEISEIIPEVSEDGNWVAKTQRQKDFSTWYTQQGVPTQQALLNFGAPYVRALRSFERWEKAQVKEREKAAGAQSSRMEGGQQPSSKGRRVRASGPQTNQEAFLAGFNEVMNEGK